MRVILDTNILISALMVQTGPPGKIYRARSEDVYTLLTCQQQLYELRQVLARPTIIGRIRPHPAGRLVNELKNLAVMIDPPPQVERSPDPEDDLLLAAAEAGKADFLVTGDKSGLLSLTKHGEARIVTATDFAAQLA